MFLYSQPLSAPAPRITRKPPGDNAHARLHSGTGSAFGRTFLGIRGVKRKAREEGRSDKAHAQYTNFRGSHDRLSCTEKGSRNSEKVCLGAIDKF